jgi:hypothetical protein
MQWLGRSWLWFGVDPARRSEQWVIEVRWTEAVLNRLAPRIEAIVVEGDSLLSCLRDPVVRRLLRVNARVRAIRLR